MFGTAEEYPLNRYLRYCKAHLQLDAPGRKGRHILDGELGMQRHEHGSTGDEGGLQGRRTEQMF